MPFPAVFDFRALGDRVAGLGDGGAVEAEVGLLVPGGGAVGVGGDGGVLVGELGGGGAGVSGRGGGEGSGVEEGALLEERGERWWAVRHWASL